MLFGGDFRQTLPIIQHGTAVQVVAACVNRALFWPLVKVHKLVQNMRVSTLEALGLDASSLEAFASFLLEVGEGRIAEKIVNNRKYIALPDALKLPPMEYDLDGLIYFVYNERDWGNVDWLTSRSILAPTNAQVDMINNKMLELFLGDIDGMALSTDVVERDLCGDDPYADFPMEVLHTFEFSGMPDHAIPLKVGMPLILLRNMNGAEGQVNGTRLILRGALQYVLDVEIASGSHQGERTFLPRIKLSPSDSDCPFKFHRLQFPIRPAFALTIDKSQGQTLEKLGLFLTSPVFSHGQLYTALSRVGAMDRIKAYVGRPLIGGDTTMYTKNVVSRAVFR